MTAIHYDFRSDTVTRPSPAMRAAMAAAEVGDDVFGDDPTINRLEAVAAERLGKEAAVFVSSGTQSNLLALMAHCGRGDAYIAGMDAHCYAHEQGGAAWIGGLLPQPLPHQADGTLALGDIASAIHGGDDPHVAQTRLLALENTFGGRVMPLTWIGEATALARARGLGTHLDGARVFNAAVAGNVDVLEIAKPFDTVSVCLSKGLGAPVGTVLIGSKELIGRARRLRKALGGGMRQVGILAAAGLYALKHNVDRLAEDHANARRLAEGFSRIPALSVEQNTNIVWVKIAPDRARAFTDYLAAEGFGITGGYPGATAPQQRWVTHLDVDRAAVDAAIAAAERFFMSHRAIA